MTKKNQELYDAQLIEPVRSNFIRALWFLHEQTNRLPPLTDCKCFLRINYSIVLQPSLVTGQITFDVVDHILSGNTYSGEWLGTEKVCNAEPSPSQCIMTTARWN
jgi:hypothetical protein